MLPDDLTPEEQAAAAKKARDMLAEWQRRRDTEQVRMHERHAEEKAWEDSHAEILRRFFEVSARAEKFHATAAKGDQQQGQQPGQTPGQHFSADEYREIMKIWHRAGAVEQEHTVDHLRLALPPHGKVATLTRREITGPSGHHEAIRAAVLTGNMLWGGVHLSGDRESQLWGRAYAEVLGVTKVTTEAVFTREEQKRLGDIVTVLRADEAAAAQSGPGLRGGQGQGRSNHQTGPVP